MPKLQPRFRWIPAAAGVAIFHTMQQAPSVRLEELLKAPETLQQSLENVRSRLSGSPIEETWYGDNNNTNDNQIASSPLPYPRSYPDTPDSANTRPGQREFSLPSPSPVQKYEPEFNSCLRSAIFCSAVSSTDSARAMGRDPRSERSELYEGLVLGRTTRTARARARGVVLVHTQRRRVSFNAAAVHVRIRACGRTSTVRRALGGRTEARQLVIHAPFFSSLGHPSPAHRVTDVGFRHP